MRILSWDDLGIKITLESKTIDAENIVAKYLNSMHEDPDFVNNLIDCYKHFLLYGKPFPKDVIK